LSASLFILFSRDLRKRTIGGGDNVRGELFVRHLVHAFQLAGQLYGGGEHKSPSSSSAADPSRPPLAAERLVQSKKSHQTTTRADKEESPKGMEKALAISLPPTRHGGLPKVKGVHIKKDEAKSSDLIHSLKPANKIEEKGKGKKDSNKQQSSPAGKGKKKMHQVGDTPKKSKDKKATSAVDFVKEPPPTMKLSPATASDVTASSSSGDGNREREREKEVLPVVGEQTVGYSRDRNFSTNSTNDYFSMNISVPVK
jgi:hypothetical protein